MINTETLTKEQTNLYFKYLKEGKIEYREKIILGNYRLVVYIAQKYVREGFDLDELISIGIIGLIKAVDSYDTLKGAGFGTYASRCINNEIYMTFRRYKSWSSINDEYVKFKDGNKISLEETLSDNKNMEDEIVDSIVLEENIEILKEILKNMNNRNSEIILDYYGIDRLRLNQVQIAEKYHISRESVSRTIRKVLIELKKQIEFQTNSSQKLLTNKQKNNKINM